MSGYSMCEDGCLTSNDAVSDGDFRAHCNTRGQC